MAFQDYGRGRLFGSSRVQFGQACGWESSQVNGVGIPCELRISSMDPVMDDSVDETEDDGCFADLAAQMALLVMDDDDDDAHALRSTSEATASLKHNTLYVDLAGKGNSIAANAEHSLSFYSNFCGPEQKRAQPHAGISNTYHQVWPQYGGGENGHMAVSEIVHPLPFPNTRPATCFGKLVKRECSGTGVFIPRSCRTSSDNRNKQEPEQHSANFSKAAHLMVDRSRENSLFINLNLIIRRRFQELLGVHVMEARECEAIA
eukprot:Gb_35724 [translate_table: standard]